MQGGRDEVDGWLVMARLMAGDGMDDKDIWVWWLPAVFGVFIDIHMLGAASPGDLVRGQPGERHFSTADAGGMRDGV